MQLESPICPARVLELDACTYMLPSASDQTSLKRRLLCDKHQNIHEMVSDRNSQAET